MLEKLNRLLCYITLATFAGHLGAGRMCPKTTTNLAELLLKTLQEPQCKRLWHLELPLSPF